jgi:hypothetical protein
LGIQTLLEPALCTGGLSSSAWDMGMKKPVVWIVDREHWPRAYLRAELIERGFDAVGFESLVDALTALHRRLYETPQVILIELRDLPVEREGLSALIGFGVPTIALGGAVELNRQVVREMAWEAVMQRPFTIGMAADMVEKVSKRPHP